jgi:cobalamin biosynthesis protein CobT
MSFEQKFSAFVAILDEELELPDEAKEIIKNAMIKAKFNQVETIEVEKAKRKLTSYNLFVREQMQDTKGNDMKNIAAKWKTLSKKQKAEWKVKAGKVENLAKVKAPRKQTGYNLFMKEIMPKVKTDKAVAATDRLKEVGRLWRKLSKAEQAKYNQRAKGTETKKKAKSVKEDEKKEEDVEEKEEEEEDVEEKEEEEEDVEEKEEEEVEENEEASEKEEEDVEEKEEEEVEENEEASEKEEVEEDDEDA